MINKLSSINYTLKKKRNTRLCIQHTFIKVPFSDFENLIENVAPFLNL